MYSLSSSLVSLKVSQDPCDAHTTSASSTLRFGTKGSFHPLLEYWYGVSLINTKPFYVTIYTTTIILIYPAYWQQLPLNFCEMVNSQAISIKFETQLHRESLNIITWVHVTMVTKQ